MSMRRRVGSLLLCLGAALWLLPTPGVRRARAKETGPARPAHVIVVILGGGVRARDMLDKQRMPTLVGMADAGRVVKAIRSDAPEGYSAVARLLTGCAASVAGSETRPSKPTLMEYVRVGRNLSPEQVWYVSFEGRDQLKLAYSTHPAFGRGAAPSVASGLGAFGTPLASFLDRVGRPDPMPPAAWGLLRGLRALNRRTVQFDLPAAGVPAGGARSERMERALLEEIDRRASLVRGPAPRDERAWRAARTVLKVYRPILTVIRLGEAEQAQKSEARYLEVLRANDAGLRRLRRLVLADPELRGRTLFVVVPELGRNARPNERGGLDQADGSPDHRELSLVAEGPGFKAKRGRIKRKRRIEDLCPTLGVLLGVPTPEAQGTAWLPILRELEK